MKKLFVSIAACAMMFTACKKYEVSEGITEETISSLPKVTIKGKVYAQLDETSGQTVEKWKAVDGRKVYATVDYSQYGLTASGHYNCPVAVITNGEYSIQVPVDADGVQVTLVFEEFPALVKNVSAVLEPETVEKWFKVTTPQTFTVGAGNKDQIVTRDVTYNSSTPYDPNYDVNTFKPTKTVTLKGELKYVKTDSMTYFGRPDIEALAAEVKVYAEITLHERAGITSGRTYKIKKVCQTTDGGNYTFEIPMVEGGEAVVTLTSEAFWARTTAKSSGNVKELCRYDLKATSYPYNDLTFSVYNNAMIKNAKYRVQSVINELED